MRERFVILSLYLLCCLVAYEGADIQGFDDTVLFKINWPGDDGNSILETGDVEPLIVSTQSKEKYKCLIPQVQEKEKDSVEEYEGPNPLELLSTLFSPSTPCSHRLESYWTYELCHGRYIRQFHEEREGKKIKQQEYILGRWDKTQHQKLYGEIERQTKSKQSAIPVKKIDGVSMPFLEINMTDGTICDLNGKPRVTKVLYVCYAQPKHEITSLKETSTCEYEVVVLSPLLCKHPSYRPQESGENIINCQPLEGSPSKPKKLLLQEAESLKLRSQKILDEKLQQVYAVFSFDREGQDGETRLRVEIHPMDMSTENLVPPEAPPTPEHLIPQDTSPVVSFLSGKNCLTGGTGWWKYEFCYGVSVIQFHEEKGGSRTVVDLGHFDKEAHLDWLEKNPHKRPKPLSHRKHVSHLYTGGTICDKTGQPRQTEKMPRRHSCLYKPDNFCYICGKFTFARNRKKISAVIEKAYKHYFGVEVGDQDKEWAPHFCCATCYCKLIEWWKGKENVVLFAVPMVWREPKDHVTDCYFCLTKIQGFSNKKSKRDIVYPDLRSARKPVEHSDGLPVPSRPRDEIQSDSDVNCVE